METEGFWINISAESGMPTRMSDDFMRPLEESTDEHRLKWKRVLAENAPEADDAGVLDTPFALRATDIDPFDHVNNAVRSEEHTSELQSLMRISYDVFCL